MNTKTIEELERIKAAVLAECERLCKDGAQPKFYWGGVCMRDGLPMYRLHIPSMLSVGGYIQDIPETILRILYALMGLEARYAVEAERAKNGVVARSPQSVIGRQKVTLDERLSAMRDRKRQIIELETRAAALVEALEEIWAMTQNIHGATLMSLSADIAIRSDQATAAHKEGGAND